MVEIVLNFYVQNLRYNSQRTSSDVLAFRSAFAICSLLESYVNEVKDEEWSDNILTHFPWYECNEIGEKPPVRTAKEKLFAWPGLWPGLGLLDQRFGFLFGLAGRALSADRGSSFGSCFACTSSGSSRSSWTAWVKACHIRWQKTKNRHDITLKCLRVYKCMKRWQVVSEVRPACAAPPQRQCSLGNQHLHPWSHFSCTHHLETISTECEYKNVQESSRAISESSSYFSEQTCAVDLGCGEVSTITNTAITTAKAKDGQTEVSNS